MKEKSYFLYYFITPRGESRILQKGGWAEGAFAKILAAHPRRMSFTLRKSKVVKKQASLLNPREIQNQRYYLGVLLNSKMSLKPFYAHVKKTVYSKLFIFRKIRNYLTEYASIMLYKQMILPFMEYAGFMFVACNLEDRRELQKCQNDALRLCVRSKIPDRVKFSEMHAKCKIISLEQRRQIQLLLLMYKKSKDQSCHKVFPRNTRESVCIVFKMDQ